MVQYSDLRGHRSQLHATYKGHVVPILALQIVMDVLENKQGAISKNL